MSFDPASFDKGIFGPLGNGMTDAFVNLKSIFIVRHSASAQLKGIFIVRHSVSLPPTPGSDLVLWLKLDEGIGITAEDSSGQENDGTLLPPGSEPTWVNGKYKKALNFDGLNDYVECQDISVNRLTLCAWINPTVNNNWKQASVINKVYDYSPWLVWKFGLTDTGKLRSDVRAGGANRSVSSSSTIQTNQWTHIAFTFDGKILRNYINGKLEDTTTLAEYYDINDIDTNVRVGFEISNYRYFIGLIDEVRIYSRALTPEQIWQEYIDSLLKGIFITQHSDSEQVKGVSTIRHSDSENLKGIFIARHSASAQLKGVFTVRHSSFEQFKAKAIIRYSSSEQFKSLFIVRHSASAQLKGIAVLRHSGYADLKGILQVTHYEDLFSKLIVRHSDLEQLKGITNIRHSDYENLKGSIIIRHSDSEQIKDIFTVRHSDNKRVKGLFTVRHSGFEQLKAKTIIRYSDSEQFKGFTTVRQSNSEQVKDIFTVRHSDSKALKGIFVIRCSDNEPLKNIFLVRHSKFENLKAKAIIRHAGGLAPKGVFIVRHSSSEQVKGIFVARHLDSEQVKGIFFVRRSASAQFKGIFKIRHSGSEQIKGLVIIRHSGSRDLKGIAVIRHTYLSWPITRLKASFRVNMEYDRLLAVARIRHSTSSRLLCELRVGRLSSASLKAVFIVRQAVSRNLKSVFKVRRSSSAQLKAVITIQHFQDLKCSFYVLSPLQNNEQIIRDDNIAGWLNYLECIGEGFISEPIITNDSIVKTSGIDSAKIFSVYNSQKYKEIRFGWRVTPFVEVPRPKGFGEVPSRLKAILIVNHP